MSETKSIALFGGTFDPIHNGHVHLLERISEEFSFDKIILLPCKQSPHKENAPTANNEQRIEMCEIATAHLKNVEVSDWEINQESVSYSWRTVEHFKTLSPRAEMHWVLGTDQWDVIHRWARYDYLRFHLRFIVVERQAKVLERTDATYETLVFDNKMSSTMIRKKLRSNNQPTELLPGVLDYITSKKLYGWLGSD